MKVLCNRCKEMAFDRPPWSMLCQKCEDLAPPAMVRACERAHRHRQMERRLGAGPMPDRQHFMWLKPFRELRAWAMSQNVKGPDTPQ